MAPSTRTMVQTKAIVSGFGKDREGTIKALIIYFESLCDALSNVKELRNHLFDHYNTTSGHSAIAHAGVWVDEVRDDMNYVHGALAALEMLDANEEEKAQ